MRDTKVRMGKTFVGAVLAGLSIGLGGVIFLSLDNRVLGAALFTVGLFTVCTFGLNLFTGKVCYVFQNDRTYALNLPVIWLGNLVGTGLTALCVGLTRSAPRSRKRPRRCARSRLATISRASFSSACCAIFSSILPSRASKTTRTISGNISHWCSV